MCGIFVVISKNKSKININYCNSHLNLLKHRGPDYSFFFLPQENVFFGQTVLSLVGSKKFKKNNFFSESRNYLTLFNGEIYNYQEILNNYLSDKRDLIISDQLSDTKILTNFFEKKKIDEINNILDGMYVYVVFEKKKKKIYFSRDMQGEKSLYIYQDKNKIILSSEINPIIKYNNSFKLKLGKLKNYFFSRHYVQFEDTLFTNITQLLPGSLMEIDLVKYKIKELKKYSLEDLISEKKFINYDKQKEEQVIEYFNYIFRKNLFQMIPQNRKYASVMSGGVDSGLISYYLKEISKPDFYIFLDHPEKDIFSKKIIFFKKIFNNLKIFEVNPDIYFSNLIKSINVNCAPINSHDFVGKFMLGQILKKKNCNILFGGDGADELFGGYNTYNQKIKKSYLNYSDYSKVVCPDFLKKDQYFYDFKKKNFNFWKKSLQNYSFIKNKNLRNRYAMMFMDSTIQLSSVGLRGTDLMLMQNSVEGRSVFLRKEIIDFALNLPLKFKINKSKNSLKNKILLKKIFIEKFTNKLLFKKQGFPGYPNETEKFLNLKEKKIILSDVLNIDLKKKLLNLSNDMRWKIYNCEFFLRKFLN